MTPRPLPPTVLLLALTVGACAPLPPEGLRVGEKNTDKLSAAFGDPILLEQSKFVLIPFGVLAPDGGGSKGMFSDSGSFFGSASYAGGFGSSLGGSVSAFGDDYLRADAGNWNNVVFYDTAGGGTHLLLDRRAVITEAFLPRAPKKGDRPDAPGPRPMLFALAEADTNGDKFINREDAVVLFLSTPDGRSLTPLTPAGMRYAEHTLDPARAALYARVVRDTNGDRRFGSGDETIFLRVDLNNPGQGQPILPTDLAGRASALVTGGGDDAPPARRGR